jgi:seryl-tRNA synthetase
MIMSYEPIREEDLQQLRDAMHSGLSAQQCRRLISELERAERERQRLQDEIENVRAGRSAMRTALLTELQETRAQLAAAPKSPEVSNEEVAEVVGYAMGYEDGIKSADIDEAGIQEMRASTRIAKDSGFKMVLVNADVMMSILNEVLEQRAWIRVAAESNGAVDAYLKQIEPSLKVPYGMPVDGVRHVIEMLQEQIRILREKCG